MENIILTGMPGCGKSTVGVVLAKNLGYNFVDTDLLIAREADKPLQRIIDEEGLERFESLETYVGENLKCNKTVVATGGSMVLCEKAMENLKSLGKVVYIKVSIDELERRLGNFSTRGIVMKKGQTIRDVYNMRKEYYEKYADVVLEEKSNSKMGDNIDELIKLL